MKNDDIEKGLGGSDKLSKSGSVQLQDAEQEIESRDGLEVGGENLQRSYALSASRNYFGSAMPSSVFLNGRWRNGFYTGYGFCVFPEGEAEESGLGFEGIPHPDFENQAEAFCSAISAVRTSLEERGRRSVRGAVLLARCQGFFLGAIAALVIVELML